MVSFETMAQKNGYFERDGKKYVLLRQAYIDGPVGAPYYTALAVIPDDGMDDDGMYPVYNVTWFPLLAWLDGDMEDEGDACDWDNPDEVVKTMSGYYLDEDRIV